MSVFDEVQRKVESGPARLVRTAIAKSAPKIPWEASSVIAGAARGGVSGAIDAAAKVARFRKNALFGSMLGALGSSPSPLNLIGKQIAGLFGNGGPASGGASKVVGGVSLEKAREIFDRTSKIDYARKNLFFLSISEVSPVGNWLSNGVADINLFATEVSYTPITIQGDPVSAGAAVFDALKGTERVEVRVVTLDDDYGRVKRWFDQKAASVAAADGTFGLPVDYLLKLTVLHAFISEDAPDAENGVKNSYLVRPGSLEHGLSRREDNLEELQMSFVQHDTFTSIK